VGRASRRALTHQGHPEDGVTTIAALDPDRADLRPPATAVPGQDVDLVVGRQNAAELAFELAPGQRTSSGATTEKKLRARRSPNVSIAASLS
jgi:hypothetical protein